MIVLLIIILKYLYFIINIIITTTCSFITSNIDYNAPLKKLNVYEIYFCQLIYDNANITFG
jgi:ABC-type antimicrobial peptide transport system permease subunit